MIDLDDDIYRVIGYESPDKDIKLDIDQNDYNDSESSLTSSLYNQIDLKCQQQNQEAYDMMEDHNNNED